MDQEITVWKDFYNFWLKAQIPLHILRFEDVVTNPKENLMGLMKFLLDTKNLEGTHIEHYVNLACQEPLRQIYKPREGKINNNTDKYSLDQIQKLFEIAKEEIIRFGY
mmetsp:Transcript_36582/g.35378  ORF Transcript_36582/g.35378 Transcript_36582/m.35378 type:complete len:108 (-) Transcript_36582:290-613(-)